MQDVKSIVIFQFIFHYFRNWSGEEIVRRLNVLLHNQTPLPEIDRHLRWIFCPFVIRGVKTLCIADLIRSSMFKCLH